MSPNQLKERPGVYLSYHEGSKKSMVIVEQLKEFLDQWGLHCPLIRKIEGTESPLHKMTKQLNKSKFFLQLFTDHKNVRKWMKWELREAQRLRKQPGAGIESPIVLHTSETNLNDRSFGQMRSKYKKGTITIVNLDEEAEVHTFLYGLLVDAKQLQKDHGPIQLPPFCQPPVVAEQITLEIVEKFIKNFKQATVKGLEMVLANRKELEPYLKDQLKRLGQEKGCIRMIGITLNKTVLSEQPNDVGSAFKSAIKNGASAELLILDLNCEAAKERAKIESHNIPFEKSLLYRHSREVSKSYANHPKVNIQCYRAPYAGLILFEDEAYVEIYHLGKQIRNRNICGEVPILILKRRRQRDLFELFAQHFSSVWKNTRSGAERQTSIQVPVPVARAAASGSQ